PTRRSTPSAAQAWPPSAPGCRRAGRSVAPSRTRRRPRSSARCPAPPPGRGSAQAQASAASGVDRLVGRGVRPAVTGLVLLDDRVQRELPARVDLGELDLDLLAHAEHVLDRVDPLAADEATDLADVQQAV